MRVSTKADYALRALIEIAQRGDVVSAEQIGSSQDIPHGFLQSILADLRRAGIVMSQRGQSGGWRMGRPPGDVSVADVIRAVSVSTSANGPCPRTSSRPSTSKRLNSMSRRLLL